MSGCSPWTRGRRPGSGVSPGWAGSRVRGAPRVRAQAACRSRTRRPRVLDSRTVLFAVRLERGGPWDWSRGLREQDDFDEHARYMDALVEEGFVVLGGPLDPGRDVLLAMSAPSADTIRDRLGAEDIWHRNGMLTIKSIEPWTILLDGRSA